MIDDFISIGKITSTFGLKGFLKVASSGDILPSLKANSVLYVASNSDLKPRKLLEIRKIKNQFILSVEDCKSIEEAEKLVGSILYFPKKSSKELLGADEFFVHQLIGLHPHFGKTVYTEFTLTEVIENPVHPILLFSDSNTEILIPYINQFVGKVDLENSRIEILNWQDWINAD